MGSKEQQNQTQLYVQVWAGTAQVELKNVTISASGCAFLLTYAGMVGATGIVSAFSRLPVHPVSMKANSRTRMNLILWTPHSHVAPNVAPCIPAKEAAKLRRPCNARQIGAMTDSLASQCAQ